MAVTTFIPEIWAARLLEHLDKAHVYAALMNRDYEGEIRNAGDTVHINTIGDITVDDYDGTDITYEALSTSSQDLKIDQAKYFAFGVDDIEKAQALPGLVEAATQRAAYAINDEADAYLAGLLATGGTDITGGSALAVTEANIYKALVQMKVALDKANVPMDGRWVVIDPTAHGLLLQDKRFVSFGTDINNERLVNGRVGRAVGMDIYVSNNVPVSDDDEYSLIAGVPMAATYAEQIIETEALRDIATFKDLVRGLHVYGAKVTRAAAIAVLPVTYADESE